MLGLNLATKLCHSNRVANVQSVRFLRAKWERAYLKDLYHRRVLLGADAPIERSSYPNWNWDAEVSAFMHRIDAPHLDKQSIGRICHGGSDESTSGASEVLTTTTKGLLRYNFPQAPEEMIDALCNYLTCEHMLAEIGSLIGLDTLLSGDPSTVRIADSFRALVQLLGREKCRPLVSSLLLPQLYDVDFADAFPLSDPMGVLTDIYLERGAKEVDARLLRSSGESTAQPLFVVGIYKDRSEVIGESAGESIPIACDMAAREGLLRVWGMTAQRMLLVGSSTDAAPADAFDTPNASLRDAVRASTDISVQTELPSEPLSMVEAALKYKSVVEKEVGKSYTKRLRHAFSRGSLAKRSFRYLVKPKTYTVS